MAPALRPGTLLISFRQSNYAPGEIISFRLAKGTVVTHRIVRTVSGGWITRGDANNVEDSWLVTPEMVIGRVVFQVPKVGYLFLWGRRFLLTPLGFIIGWAVAVFLIWRWLLRHLFPSWHLSLVVFLSLGAFLMTNSRPTNTLFSDQAVSANNVFRAGDWQPPQSAIDDVEDDQGNSLTLTSLATVRVLYQASDSGSGVAYSELWYSHNNESWQHYGNSQNGLFQFHFPAGPGTYRLITVAVDNTGRIEDKNNDGIADNAASDQLELVANGLEFEGKLTYIDFDNQPPTLNLAVDDNQGWQGQSALENGNFQEGMKGWQAGGAGDHHVVSNGEDLNGNPIVPSGGGQMFLLGFKSADKNGVDFLRRQLTIPAHTSAWLGFSYRMLSEDTVDYDWLTVWLGGHQGEGKTIILRTGNGENDDWYNGDDLSGWQDDSGWRRVKRMLPAKGERQLDLNFQLESHLNPNGPGRSWAYINNVSLHFLDPRLKPTANLSFDVHDASGSGVAAVTYQVNNNPPADFDGAPLNLPSGEATIAAQASDWADNQGRAKAEVKVMADIVLQAFSAAPSSGDEWVDLYNNSNQAIDVAGWRICDEAHHCTPLTSANAVGGTTLIAATSSQRFQGNFYLNNDGDSLILEDNNQQQKDKFTYPDFQGWHDRVWSRQPSGLGSWHLGGAGLAANIESRYEQMGKILLTIFNIEDDYCQHQPLEYEITYHNQAGLEKGIAGTILPTEVANHQASREFYLGSCSSGGTCVGDQVANRQVVLTLRRGGTILIDHQVFKI